MGRADAAMGGLSARHEARHAESFQAWRASSFSGASAAAECPSSTTAPTGSSFAHLEPARLPRGDERSDEEKLLSKRKEFWNGFRR
jgi:hypothetical protein